MGDFIDIWWKMEMLKTVTDMNQRNQMMSDIKADPNYEKWRKSEADKLAQENKELKEQLAAVDSAKAESVSTTPTDTASSAPVKKSGGLGWFWWLVIFCGIAGLGWWGWRRLNKNW